MFSGPTEVPALEVDSAPLQLSEPLPPLAVQPVALLLDQLMLIVPPTCTLAGDTLNVSTLATGGAAVAVTCTELGVEAPPLPVQVSV